MQVAITNYTTPPMEKNKKIKSILYFYFISLYNQSKDNQGI
jgi:hypothetical protein